MVSYFMWLPEAARVQFAFFASELGIALGIALVHGKNYKDAVKVLTAAMSGDDGNLQHLENAMTSDSIQGALRGMP